MVAVVFRGEIAAREHRQLLECALKRDAQTAQTLLIKHIQDCVTYTFSNGPVPLRGSFDHQTAKRRKTMTTVSASA
jgi:hypothetical protein